MQTAAPATPMTQALVETAHTPEMPAPLEPLALDDAPAPEMAPAPRQTPAEPEIDDSAVELSLVNVESPTTVAEADTETIAEAPVEARLAVGEADPESAPIPSHASEPATTPLPTPVPEPTMLPPPRSTGGGLNPKVIGAVAAAVMVGVGLAWTLTSKDKSAEPASANAAVNSEPAPAAPDAAPVLAPAPLAAHATAPKAAEPAAMTVATTKTAPVPAPKSAPAPKRTQDSERMDRANKTLDDLLK